MTPSSRPRARCAASVVWLAAAWLGLGAAVTGQASTTGGLHDRQAEDRILALDPERISAHDVRDVLSLSPAPRILSFKGSLLSDMASFGRFLVAMGYPATRIDEPEVSWQGCRCVECDRIAGAMAWHYEQDGMVPMLIGHSGGGVVVSRVLYALAEADDPAREPRLQVWNPLTARPEPRETVRDPVSGEPRRLAALQVPHAVVLGTGTWARRLPGFPGCAADVQRLPVVPDSAQTFTAYRIEGDPFTLGMQPYRPHAAAVVRNVRLPAATRHVDAFRLDGLAESAEARAWIDTYGPDAATPPPPGAPAANLMHAADLWHGIKKHWCLQAQRLILARRAHQGGSAMP